MNNLAEVNTNIETRKLRKSGASLAVTIPSGMCKLLKLEEGLNVEFQVDKNRLLIKPIRQKMTVQDRIAMYKEQGLKRSETLHDPEIE